MSKLDEAFAILDMDPLPDDAEERIEKLAQAAADEDERNNILSLLEALFVQRHRPDA